VFWFLLKALKNNGVLEYPIGGIFLKDIKLALNQEPSLKIYLELGMVLKQTEHYF